MMFGPKMGTWWIHSESDPRWRARGRAMGLVSSGGPKEMHDKIEELKKKYGEPPADATMGFEKD